MNTENVSTQGSLSLSEIFDFLMQGKKLVLNFLSPSAAESFRTSLYRFKRRQENQMEEVGIDFDKYSLRWTVREVVFSLSGETRYAVTFFLALKESTVYEVVSITDVDQTDEQH